MTLTLQGIRKQQADDVHLYDLDVAFMPGLNVLAGPTLAGKTSLLRIIAGLDQPNAGQVLLNGRDITRIPVRKRSVAIVYQQYINYPNFTVYENIASPLRLAKMSAQAIDKKVRETAELLSINDYLHRLPSELSGGQQQRTAIARALVKDADIILFDEPLVNLDYKLREQLRREMRSIFSAQNKIAIYATTEPLEAALLGEHLLVLDEGKVLQTGSAKALFKHPVSLRVAEILSEPRINSIPAQVTNGLVQLQEAINFNLDPALAIKDGAYRLALRPHQLHIVSQQQLDPGSVQFSAAVTLAEVSGSETLIHIKLGACHWIVQQAGVHRYQLGDTVELYFSPQDLLWFDQQTQVDMGGSGSVDLERAS